MSSASDAGRIAAGALPSELVASGRAPHPSRSGAGHDNQPTAPYDPLRLCIFATIALLGWVAGPAALTMFAAIGFAGYWKARRNGLKKSNCYLQDTRLVLTYLGALLGAGLWGIYALVAGFLGP